MDLSVSLTPKTLEFYRRLLNQPIPQLRIASAGVIRTFVAKGIKDPSDRLQILKVLDIVQTLDPLEASTRGQDDGLRVALAGILGVLGTELVEFWEDVSCRPVIREYEADTR